MKNRPHPIEMNSDPGTPPFGDLGTQSLQQGLDGHPGNIRANRIIKNRLERPPLLAIHPR